MLSQTGMCMIELCSSTSACDLTSLFSLTYSPLSLLSINDDTLTYLDLGKHSKGGTPLWRNLYIMLLSCHFRLNLITYIYCIQYWKQWKYYMTHSPIHPRTFFYLTLTHIYAFLFEIFAVLYMLYMFILTALIFTSIWSIKDGCSFWVCKMKSIICGCENPSGPIQIYWNYEKKNIAIEIMVSVTHFICYKNSKLKSPFCKSWSYYVSERRINSYIIC